MQVFDSCTSAIQACMKTKTFAVATLSSPEKVENTTHYAIFVSPDYPLIHTFAEAELNAYFHSLMNKLNTPAAAETKSTVAGDPIISSILLYIDAHLTENLNLRLLADQFFVSVSFLCKSFKLATGTTPHRYIVQKRLILAKYFLSLGYPVIEVCGLCGFNDYNTFLKAFTKEMGISPKRYTQCTQLPPTPIIPQPNLPSPPECMIPPGFLKD